MDSPERREPRILLVEDDPVDRMAVECLFAREALPYEIVCAGTVAEAVEIHREHPPDLVLLNHGLPDGTGLELQALLEGTPCVFITGEEDVSIAIQAMKGGALDFLVKDAGRSCVELLPTVIERALEVHGLREEVRRHAEELDGLVIARTRELEEANERLRQEITERELAEEALRESESKLIEAQRIAKLGYYDMDVKTGRWTSSAELDDIFGIDENYRRDVDGWLQLVHPESRETMAVYFRDHVLTRHNQFDKEYQIFDPRTGQDKWVHGLGSLIFDDNDDPVGMFGTIQDVTEHQQLEEQLRQAQKMEAIGQLTGGIAHDFNNVLSVVFLNTELVMAAVEAGECVERSEVAAIVDAAEKASAMTRQLLGFGRRAELKPVPTDVARVTGELTSMLRTFLPETIDVSIRADEPVGTVEVDPSSVEQILLNLASNARDAMPEGGRFEIEVGEVELDDGYSAGRPHVEPGSYVRVSVTDTGVGMDEETRNRIFEPFFTTKEPGKGTGLGMSMVYGLMKQQGGHVYVYSEPGMGTKITLYFPTVQAAAQESPREDREMRLVGGTETILLVEDEEALRRAGRRVLESQGYTVLEAANGEEGLGVYRAHAEEIDLVISDLVMPKMGGEELYEALEAEERPPPAFILASGYTGQEIGKGTALPEFLPYLQKPWHLDELLSLVRDVLDHA